MQDEVYSIIGQGLRYNPNLKFILFEQDILLLKSGSAKAQETLLTHGLQLQVQVFVVVESNLLVADQLVLSIFFK